MSIRTEAMPPSVPAPGTRMTVDAFVEAYADRDARVELWNGEVVEMAPGPGEAHGALQIEIGYLLRAYLGANRIGRPTGDSDIAVSDDTILRPDVAVALTKPGDTPSVRHRETVPELIVEIVSPSDRYSAVVKKARLWLGGGARLVWVVDPAQRTVQVFTPAGDRILTGPDVLDGGDVLPGLAIPVTAVFAPLDPA